MAAAGVEPVRLTGLAALRLGLRFARDPLMATRYAFETWGPFVALAEALPFTKRARTVMLGVPLVLTAGATLNAEVLSAPETWRGVSVLPGGPRGSAARRMTAGLPRLTGAQHAHYRKLLGQPLRRASVEAMAATMARLAAQETASWPLGATIDLWDHVRRIMQLFSVELLFGGDSGQSRNIAERSARIMERKWGTGAVALPINLPTTAYGRIVRDCERLERDILQWAKAKRGCRDDRDLASIVINSPGADGKPPDDAAIVAHIASMFALSSEGGQSVVTWTLFLLALYPRIAEKLRDELRGQLGAGSPALHRAGELAYLDAVVKESMRVLPPVPLQMRVAVRDTTLAGHALPRGTRLLLNAFLTNRMADFHPDGDAFRPERWSALTPNAFEFPVFGAGPHICPGFWFGTAAIKIALAAILARFQVELPAGARIDYRAQPTLRPGQVLQVRLRRADAGLPAAVPIAGAIRNLVRIER